MPLPTPVQGESRSTFIERCVPEAMKEAESNEQAVAICTAQFNRDDADELDRTPPKTAQENARKVLRWKDEKGEEVAGMTRTGWTRARQLARGEPLSWDTIGRIAAFERHRQNAEIDPEHKGKPWRDAGYVAWMGWGGDVGIRWAQRMMEKREKQRGDSVNDGKNQIRVDSGELSGRVERTEEGYLRGDAVVTRTGVFAYRNEDGTTRRELRHPDDVYEAESLSTIKMIPVTDGHPGELVTAENANALAKGQTGENIRIDGRFVIAPLTVTHADMITSIEDGKSELSLGYMVDVVEEDGEYNGEPYTHRQRNIRYNHLAIVDRARAGAAARLNMDGAAVQESDPNPNREGETMTKKVTLDGIEYEAAPEVINALQRAESRADELDGELKDAQKRVDEAEAKADAAVEERDKLKADASDEKVAERVQQRLDVERKAAKVLTLDEQAAKLSDRDLMLKAITAHNDSLDLSDRSDDYVRARFDSVIEAAEAEGIQRQRERVAGGRNDDAGGAPVDSEKARQDAATDITTAWKRNKPAAK